MVSVMAIILQESLRAVFYAPFYVALARDAFTAEGVEIRFTSSPRPQDAALRLMDGTVDVCWGGPMRVMETYQKRPDCDIVSFAEVVTRDPFLLMGREPRPDFTLADLKSVRLATVSEVPTPWLCLQHDLRLAGIDPESISRVAGQTMASNMAALKAGEVDVVQVFEPFPSLLLAEGAAHVWYEAARRGPTSYTTFYARRGLLTARRDELQRMVRAIHRTEMWVAKASGQADRTGDLGLLQRHGAGNPRGRLHALQETRHLERHAGDAARRLRPAARRPGVGRLRLSRGHFRDCRRQYARRRRCGRAAAAARLTCCWSTFR